MVNTEAKYQQETWEVEFLLKHLGITTFQKDESPDFTFAYEGKHIGLEHTRCFPNQKTIDSNSWRKIERKIEDELNKSELPPRYFHYCAKTHNEGKRNYKSIADEIINGYKYMLENNIYDIGALGHEEYHLNRLTYLSYFPDYAPNHYIVSEITGGFESKADIKLVLESVEKKENKLLDYKQLSKNNSIQEYWLAVFIPPEEACVVESNTTLFQNSLYDRIYLINERYIGALMQGDTSSIVRLK